MAADRNLETRGGADWVVRWRSVEWQREIVFSPAEAVGAAGWAALTSVALCERPRGVVCFLAGAVSSAGLGYRDVGGGVTWRENLIHSGWWHGGSVEGGWGEVWLDGGGEGRVGGEGVEWSVDDSSGTAMSNSLGLTARMHDPRLWGDSALQIVDFPLLVPPSAAPPHPT